MTASESTALDRLRDELHCYHVDVQRLIQRCESCRAEVVQIASDMYGLPGNKETSPGLMGEVAQLRGSRRLIVLALRGAWVLLTILLGAAATALLQSHSY
ncbi:MAG: hypothetical protein ABFC77_03545 [Thermoguttaceae bacterium]